MGHDVEHCMENYLYGQGIEEAAIQESTLGNHYRESVKNFEFEIQIFCLTSYLLHISEPQALVV